MTAAKSSLHFTLRYLDQRADAQGRRRFALTWVQPMPLNSNSPFAPSTAKQATQTQLFLTHPETVCERLKAMGHTVVEPQERDV